MHILLLSANTGEGHNSTSKAIMDVLRAQGHSCEMQDVLAFLSPRFSKFICNWHSRIYKYMPKLFDAGYGVMERNVPDPEESTPVYELLSLGAYKLYQMLLQKDFDSILCVHPFAGVMMTEVRKDWNVTVPCYFVATDYTCCPTVEQCRLDGYFIPDPALIPEFVQAGLPEDKLFPLGIPVRQSFYQKNVQYQAKSRLGLPVDGCVILLMCGSMGCGPIRRVAKALAEQLPGGSMVVAICGRNTKLQEDLLQFSHPNLRVLGFVEDIPGYMDAADIIVTKPGGLSSTEAANKHLPMVLINTIGGCESRNFDFFLSRGYALGSSNADEVIRQTVNLAANRSQQRLLHQTLSQRFHINSAQEIAQQVLTGAARYRNLPRPGTSIIPDEAGHPIPEKEGCNMDNQPKQTINNLARSFAGESQARTRYSIYAQIARKEGFEWILPIRPLSKRDLTVATAGIFRRSSRQPTFRCFSRASVRISSSSARLVHTGLSDSTCLPCCSA